MAGGGGALALPPAVPPRRRRRRPRAPPSGRWRRRCSPGSASRDPTFLADHGPRAGVGQVTPFFVAYVIAAISVRLFLGTLSDRIGRRQAATPALCGHAAILVAMAAVGATWHLVPIGLVYGFCHGIYYPTLQAMVVERSGGRRSRAISASTFAFGAGVAAAAFALGPVAHAFGYPVIYLVAAGCGALAAALVWWR
ncbi:MAG: MFS transporter [Kofleriaceae bacterium]|nr:MFS transporter [Kofleriaceae bacterium]